MGHRPELNSVGTHNLWVNYSNGKATYLSNMHWLSVRKIYTQCARRYHTPFVPVATAQHGSTTQ